MACRLGAQKERPKSYKREVDLDSAKVEREEALDLSPRISSIPMFPFPTILSDLPADESGQISGITMWTSSVRENFKATAYRHPDGRRFTMRGTEINFSLFTRMLAKIGHAFAIAEYGINSFTSLLLPLIFGKTPKDNFNHLVGRTVLVPPKSKEMFSSQLIRIWTVKRRY